MADQLIQKFDKLIIDLSGRAGLVDRFYGNYPYNAPNAQLDIYAGKGQYASGTVNPLAKYGFLSPANATAVTILSTTSGILHATLVDETQSDPFVLLYGDDGVLRRTTGLTQNTITKPTVSVSTTTGTDLEWYSIAGIRKLFFSYKTASAADIGLWDLHSLDSYSNGVNGDWMFLGYTNNGGTFITGDTITGGTSGLTAHISRNLYLGGNTGVLFLESVSAPDTGWTDGEVITDQHSHTGNVHISGGIGSSVMTHFFSTYVYNGTSNGLTLGNNNIRTIVADNGFMYILDGSALHKYDGTTTGGTDVSKSAFGTVTSNVLLFPPQYTLTDGIDLRGRLWITMFRSNRDIFSNPTNTGVYDNFCGVYVWDRITTGTSTEDFITIPGVRDVRAIVTFQGVPTIFTVSSTRYSQVRMWNGSTFKVVAELGPEAYPRFHDSISVEGDIVKWMGNDGMFYAYGKIVPDGKNALYSVGDMTAHVTTASTFSNGGAIILANGTESTSAGRNNAPIAYYLGTQDTVTKGIFKWYPDAFSPNNSNQQASTGNFFTPVYFLPKLSNPHFLTVYFPQIGTGGSSTVMNLNIYLNQSTTAWNSAAIAFTADDAQRGYKTIPLSQQNVNSVQLGITYPATTSISNIPTPSHALLEYEATPKRY